jgi:hypothetical protein
MTVTQTLKYKQDIIHIHIFLFHIQAYKNEMPQ